VTYTLSDNNCGYTIHYFLVTDCGGQQAACHYVMTTRLHYAHITTNTIVENCNVVFIG